jgi:hypothetical protein
MVDAGRVPAVKDCRYGNVTLPRRASSSARFNAGLKNQLNFLSIP